MFVLLVFYGIGLSDSSGVVNVISDLAHVGKEWLHYKNVDEIAVYPVTFSWETKEDLYSKRGSTLDNFWMEYDDEKHYYPTVAFYSGEPLKQHKSVLRNIINQYYYSGSDERKLSLQKFIQAVLRSASKVYVRKLFEDYFIELNKAISDKDDRVGSWRPVNIAKRWLQKKRWILGQQIADLKYRVYHCVCVPVAKGAFVLGATYCAVQYTCY